VRIRPALLAATEIPELSSSLPYIGLIPIKGAPWRKSSDGTAGDRRWILPIADLALLICHR